MPEICRFFGISIKMYFGDHPPPHFHAEYEEHRAIGGYWGASSSSRIGFGCRMGFPAPSGTFGTVGTCSEPSAVVQTATTRLTPAAADPPPLALWRAAELGR